MRLFHVSEEADIKEFSPRPPSRNDLDPSVGLVWAIDEKHLPNFLTPRNCPRVCYLKNGKTTPEDIERYMGNDADHIVVIEQRWLNTLRKTVLYLYEFDTEAFTLQDETAGYYVSTKTVKPIRKLVIDDPVSEISNRNAALRTVENLHPIADEIKNSSFDWSLCRMAFAEERE